MTQAAVTNLEQIDSLDTLYERVAEHNMCTGWNKPTPSIWPEPRANLLPHVWPWKDARAALHAAGGLIDTKLAERRNLVLINPREGNTYDTVRTLVSAYQMIRPGEKARSHRHAPNALRLIVEGEGAYTIVDGQRLDMTPGDVVLTPGWCWHGHGSESTTDCYWIDFLDVPLVHLLEPMFFQPHGDGFEEVRESPSQSPYVFHIKDFEPKLDAAHPDPLGGRRLAFDTPSMPTIALSVQKFAAGESSQPVRTTVNNLFGVIKGSGRTLADGVEMAWNAGDVIAVPSWRAFHHATDEGALLLNVTDEPVMAALGFLKEG